MASTPMARTPKPITSKLILITQICLFIISILHNYPHYASCAPQQQQQQQPISVSSAVTEKTADLTLLINETLSINNKTAGGIGGGGGPPVFKDDWTFDMVEYDLMEFLQDLSARYQLANSGANKSGAPENPRDKLDPSDTGSAMMKGKQDKPAVGGTDQVVGAKINQKKAQDNTTSPAAETAAPVAAAAVFSTPKQATLNQSNAGQQLVTTEAPPISLATGDHDIAESSWQYGIFDRFTRPRSSTTTTTAPEPNFGDSINSRSYNSDECGLRTYEEEPQYYPHSSMSASDIDEQQQAEALKELNQRRQKPPLGSSFFSSHKKFQSSGLAEADMGAGDPFSIQEELLRRRPSLPPFDSYGESAGAGAGPESDSAAGGASEVGGSQVAPATNSKQQYPAALAEDHSDELDYKRGDEFNLSSRRQWLQQQLGNTLQMLGYNNSAALDLLTSAGSSSQGLNLRENMMKRMTLTSQQQQQQQQHQQQQTNNYKLGKSIGSQTNIGDQKATSSQPEITEQELKARQDELKLEARVIGGSDARLGDSPWSVSLQALVSRPGTGAVEYRHYCGGTIISEYYILTAAHCLDFMVGRESRLFVVIGDLNWRMSAASLHGRRFGIEKLIIHSGYKSTAFGHDIGLIKTKESMKPLKVNGRYIINSVCLPERGIEHSGEAELVGWGLFSNRNEMADSLQIADVPILPRPLCVDLYKRRTGLIQWLIGIELITEKQICAGTFGRGICQGDSGSALVFNEKVSRAYEESGPDGKAAFRKSNSIRSQQNRATIIGIVAFGGIRRCSYQSLPGVYMQTSKYMDWILPRLQ